MNSRLFRCLSASALVVAMMSCFSPANATGKAVHPEMIVSAKWLSAHLNDPKVVILHVADKRSDYDNGH
ncbi:MAG: hypothetical protein ACXVJ1_15420, partial [Candidatus Angelobacter sp.]